jgi:hypothetical protein
MSGSNSNVQNLSYGDDSKKLHDRSHHEYVMAALIVQQNAHVVGVQSGHQKNDGERQPAENPG